MKFKINRDHFANGLAQVLNVVGSKATMPILSNVLIEAEKDQISLTTTNLDLGIRCKIKADVKEGGAVTLPVRRLATIVRELPNVDVSLDSSASHQVKLASGGSNFRAQTGRIFVSYCCAQAGCGSGICARRRKSPSFTSAARQRSSR